MRAYLVTTGVMFALIAVAHLWRIVAESRALATEPWFMGLTIAAAVMSAWAFRLLRSAPRSTGSG
jgi:hypothetical protein